MTAQRKTLDQLHAEMVAAREASLLADSIPQHSRMYREMMRNRWYAATDAYVTARDFRDA